MKNYQVAIIIGLTCAKIGLAQAAGSDCPPDSGFFQHPPEVAGKKLSGPAGSADLPPEVFGSNDCWAVMGDSITHNGYYHHYVELFYLTRFPGRALDVFNCGISGDTVPGALRRLGWDCLSVRPTVVSVMLGMNDVGRDLYGTNEVTEAIARQRAERAETYEKKLRELTQKLLKSGARVILIKPSIYDDTAKLPRPNCPGVETALAGLGRRVQRVAEELHVSTVDFNEPMRRINAARQKLDPDFTLVGADRIHPGPVGHLVMAYLFLHAQMGANRVSRIAVDAIADRPGPLENCEVKNLTTQGGRIEFDCKEYALPFPVEPSAHETLDFVPFTEEFNQETLQVRGGAATNYELGIDGQPVCTWSGKELGAGVNLAGETNTPQWRQAFKTEAILGKKWQAVSKLRTIALCEHYAWPDAKHPADAVRMNEKIATWTNQVRSVTFFLNLATQYPKLKAQEASLWSEAGAAVGQARATSQPRWHHYVLEPVEN